MMGRHVCEQVCFPNSGIEGAVFSIPRPITARRLLLSRRAAHISGSCQFSDGVHDMTMVLDRPLRQHLCFMHKYVFLM
jgi:hypothetical protein